MMPFQSMPSRGHENLKISYKTNGFISFKANFHLILISSLSPSNFHGQIAIDRRRSQGSDGERIGRDLGRGTDIATNALSEMCDHIEASINRMLSAETLTYISPSYFVYDAEAEHHLNKRYAHQIYSVMSSPRGLWNRALRSPQRSSGPFR